MDRRVTRAAGLQPVASVLTQTLRQTGLEQVMLLSQINQRWEQIVGAQIAAIARPERVRSRVLFVMVADAIWLQQLTFYQAQLIRNIRRVLGDVPISKLHFTLDASVQIPEPQGAETSDRPRLTTDEERQVVAETADITDNVLREAIRRAWRRSWRSKR